MFCFANLYKQNISEMFYTMTNSYLQTDAGHVFSEINEKMPANGKLEGRAEQIVSGAKHILLGNLGISVNFDGTVCGEHARALGVVLCS